MLIIIFFITEFKKAYQDTCDHHKESKKCDCTFCEVFGTTVNMQIKLSDRFLKNEVFSDFTRSQDQRNS